MCTLKTRENKKKKPGCVYSTQASRYGQTSPQKCQQSEDILDMCEAFVRDEENMSGARLEEDISLSLTWMKHLE